MFEGKVKDVKIAVRHGQKSEIRTVPARLLYGGLLVVFTAEEMAGKIGIPYWENQLRHELERQKIAAPLTMDFLIFQVLPDLYTALRQTLHILFANYGRTFKSGGEKQHLEQAIREHAKVGEYFLGLRKSTYEGMSKKIQLSVERILAQIGTQPRDEHKRHALGKLVQVGKVVDSLGRVNPYAKIPQVDISKLEIAERLAVITKIEPHIVARRQVLKTIIEMAELKFRALRDLLVRLLPHLEAEYFSAHGDLELRQKVNYHLAQLVGELNQFDMNPFAKLSVRIQAEVEAASRLILGGNFTSARSVLTPTLESLKLRILRTEMEHLITFLSQLLFQPQQPLEQSKIKRIKGDLKNFRARLATIDERRFQKQVCMRALSRVSEAEKLLNQRKSDKAFILGPVKRKLVGAAQLL